MRLSKTLRKVLNFLVIALTTSLLLVSVVPFLWAQTPLPEAFPTSPYPSPPPSRVRFRTTRCTPIASSPSTWLLPVPSNNPPLAKNDEYTVQPKYPNIIPVMINDTDPDCDPLTVTKVTQGEYGQVAINPDGTLIYNVATPTSDSFTYTISDGKGGTAEATVNVKD